MPTYSQAEIWVGRAALPSGRRFASRCGPTSTRGENRTARDDSDKQSLEDIVPDSNRPICRVCLSEDGVRNSLAIERVIGHQMYVSRYRRMVCATCWDRGRETPVTCRMFRAEAAWRP